MNLTHDEFLKVNIRVGRIIKVDDFPEAHKPAYLLQIDFGALGIKKSSAQITVNYSKEELISQLVLAVVNFPSKQIGPIQSEVLVLGVPDEKGEVVLVKPAEEVEIGGRVY